MGIVYDLEALYFTRVHKTMAHMETHEVEVLTPKKEAEKEWDIFEVWQKYEENAKHFNDLLMRLRLQALAGFAAVTVLLGYLANTDGREVNHHIAGLGFLALTVLWIAVWILDFGYYNRMLSGAALSLQHLEDLTRDGRKTVNILDFSTCIDKRVKYGRPGFRLDARFFFYLLVLLVFFTFMIISWRYEIGSWMCGC